MRQIEIKETDHAKLLALAEQRGEPDLSSLVGEAVRFYCKAQRAEKLETDRGVPRKKSRWAEAARFHREHPSLKAKSEQANELIRNFRDEFSV